MPSIEIKQDGASYLDRHRHRFGGVDGAEADRLHL